MALISAFNYKRPLSGNTTAGGANVAGSLSSFPICVHINSSSWPTASDRDKFFHASNTGGKRVQFYAGDQTTNLPYEVEYYDQASQEAIYWVKVPTITGNNANSNLVYVGFGNDPNASDQDQMTSVWDSNYSAVLHLGDNSWGSAPEAKDSTSNALHGTNYGSADTTGKVRKGRSCDGIDDYITIPHNAAFEFGSGDFTIEWWHYRPAGVAAGKGSIVRNSNVYAPWILAMTSGAGVDELYMSSNGTSFGIAAAKSMGTANRDIWEYLSVTRTGNTFKTYRENVEQDTWSSSLALHASSLPIQIGKYQGANFTKLSVDELRISKGIARSTDWQRLSRLSMAKTNFNGDTWITWGTLSGGATTKSAWPILRRLQHSRRSN